MQRKEMFYPGSIPGILFSKLLTLLTISFLFTSCQADLVEPGAPGASLADAQNFGNATFSASAPGPSIHWNNEKQTIDGFGISHAWYDASIKNHSKSSEILDKLYSASNGIGISIHRMRIAPNIHTGVNTYNWSSGEFTNYGWQAQQAKNRGVNKFFASCWTPPAWAKDNNNTQRGGSLLPKYYDDHANFLKAWADRMDSQYGIQLYGISIQNEPGRKEWESCEWDVVDFKNWIKNDVGPTFGNDYRLMAPEGTNAPEAKEYMDVITNDATANNYLDILTYHTYSIGPQDLGNEYNKPTWMTEKWVRSKSFNGGGLVWAREIHQGLVDKNNKAYCYWWNAVPRTDGQALINLDGSNNYEVNPQYWTFGNFSKFIRPGYKRIGAMSKPHGKVYLSAYKNTANNKIVIVAINDDDADHSFTYNFDGFTCNNFGRYRTSASQNLVQLSGKSAGSSLSMSLPARSVTTYVGTATPGGGGEPGDIANGTYKIENKQFSRRLKVSENIPNNVVHSIFNGTQASIIWTISVSGNIITARNSENSRYLKRSDTSTNTVSSCCITDRSRWELIDAGSGYYQLKNKATGEFLDADSADNNVKCNSSSPGDDKLWRFIAVN